MSLCPICLLLGTLLTALVACDPKRDSDTGPVVTDDVDQDGYPASQDCDDSISFIHPGATEICDGVDNDCDALTDEDLTQTIHPDADGDGFGDGALTEERCDGPQGYVSDGTDCDDTRAETHPSAEEACDGWDNDCDGVADEGTWYRDADGDGTGDDTTATGTCSEGSVLHGGDCDDGNAAMKPGGREACDGLDNDCSGQADDPEDEDGDGLNRCQGDCDDTDAAIHPGAPEHCAETDMDCDGVPGPGWFRCGEHDLSSADATLLGTFSDEDAGWSLSAGDANGDGVADVLVGAPAWGQSSGRVYLVLGRVRGTVDLSTANAVLEGESQNDAAGCSVSATGDLNGDGRTDFLVGAPGNDTGGSNAGAAYLVHTPIRGTESLSAAEVTLVGEATVGQAGTSVSTAGDADGDGLPDVLVGALDRAYLLKSPLSGTLELSAADATWIGEASGTPTTLLVASAGDVDGDGLADVLLGDPWDDEGGGLAGAAYLVHTPAAGTMDLSTADAKWTGEAPNDRAGQSISSAGDVNGDGYADLLVGASDGAYLLFGPAPGCLDLPAADGTLVGTTGGGATSHMVSAGGDVNGDAWADILVGEYGVYADGENVGAAFVILGPMSGLVHLSDADGKWVGEEDNDVASTVAPAGDVNDDNVDDLLVGAPGNDAVATGAGVAYVVFGGL